MWSGWGKDSKRRPLTADEIERRGARRCSPLGEVFGLIDFDFRLDSTAASMRNLHRSRPIGSIQLEDSDRHGTAHLLFYPLWFFVIVPSYYTVALAVRLAPLLAACILLGGTVEGLSLEERKSEWLSIMQRLGREWDHEVMGWDMLGSGDIKPTSISALSIALLIGKFPTQSSSCL